MLVQDVANFRLSEWTYTLCGRLRWDQAFCFPTGSLTIHKAGRSVTTPKKARVGAAVIDTARGERGEQECGIPRYNLYPILHGCLPINQQHVALFEGFFPLPGTDHWESRSPRLRPCSPLTFHKALIVFTDPARGDAHTPGSEARSVCGPGFKAFL